MCYTLIQVWRRTSSSQQLNDASSYTLVGQTLVRLTELRFHEISLPTSSRLRVTRGDVLGLYYPGSNPVGWSTVPCSSAAQRCLFISRSTREPLLVGDTFHFQTAPAGHNACRQYSFAALFGNCSQWLALSWFALCKVTCILFYAHNSESNFRQLFLPTRCYAKARCLLSKGSSVCLSICPSVTTSYRYELSILALYFTIVIVAIVTIVIYCCYFGM